MRPAAATAMICFYRGDGHNNVAAVSKDITAIFTFLEAWDIYLRDTALSIILFDLVLT